MWDPEESEQKVPLVSGEEGKLPDADPNWKGVKLEGRKCRDVIFALLYIIVFIGMLVVGSVAFGRGKPQTLNPLDSEETGYVIGTVDRYIQEAATQIRNDYSIILGAFFLSFLLALIWVQLVKMFTKVFIYITLVAGVGMVIALGVYAFQYGNKNNDQTMKIASYIIWAVAFLLICVIVFLRKKIALTAALFTESCRGVQANPAIFLVALILTVLVASFITFWIASFVYLYSIPADETEQIGQFNTSIRNLMYFHVFGLLWTLALLMAIFQHAVAGGMAVWYFSKDAHDYDKIFSPSLKALGWGITVSFGSLALGSLVLAVVQFINYLLRQAQKANKKNKVVVIITSCIMCCLSCVQSIVKFIDKFAYIYIAMHGNSFCKSARDCFELLSRNLFSAVAVDLIGDFVLFMGKLLGVAASVLMSMAILDSRGKTIHFLTIVAIAIIAYAIFSIFAHIIGVGVDTILVCYLEDIERSKDGNYHINPQLHNLLQARTEKIREAEKE